MIFLFYFIQSIFVVGVGGRDGKLCCSLNEMCFYGYVWKGLFSF
jgi:hypothetical protein